jgi:hypothetical protein
MVKNKRMFFVKRLNKMSFRLNIKIWFLAGLVFILGTGATNPAVTAALNCATSSPTSGAYTVTICFSSPTTSALTGDVTVTITASIAGTSSGIQRMVFNLNNVYLLTDYQNPYTFTLPTAHFVDGSYTISASALMRNGFISSPASITATFNNGVTTPPVNHNTFTPALGTPPASGNPLVVVAAGDGASGEANSVKVTGLISSWNPNLMLYLGDVYEEGSPTEFYNWYGTSQNFGIFQAITDPTIGNHEYLADKNAAGYFNYWNNIPNYYSFNTGGWHFVSLNANSINGQVQTKPGTAQYDWLAQDLTANTAACTIVYWHQPLYNIGAEPAQTNLQQIWALLAQHKVDIVLNGHDHDYQRWVPLDGSGQPVSGGVTEFIVGSSGHGIQTFKKTDSRVAKGFDSTTKPAPYGALRLQLYASQATFNYINTAGTVLDSGIIGCNNASGISLTTSSTPTLTPIAIPTKAPIIAKGTFSPTTLPPTNSLMMSPVAVASVTSASLSNNYETWTDIALHRLSKEMVW